MDKQRINRFDADEYESIKDDVIDYDLILNEKFGNDFQNFFACLYTRERIANLFSCSAQHISNIASKKDQDEDKKINVFNIQGYKLYLLDENMCNNFKSTSLTRKKLKLALSRHKKRIEKIKNGAIKLGNEL